MYRYHITAEPVLLVLLFAFVGYGSVKPSNDYIKFSMVYEDEMSQMTDAERDDFLQVKIATWQQYHSIITIPVALIVGIFYGAYSDARGRQINMLIGILSMMMELAGPILVYSSTVDGPLWFLLVGSFLASILGSYSMCTNGAFAYIIDVIKPSYLPLHFMGMILCVNVGRILGAVSASVLASNLSISYFLLIALLSLTVAFFYILLFIKQFPPPKKDHTNTKPDSDNSRSVGQEVPPTTPQTSEPFSIVKAYRLFILSLQQSAKVFLAKRPGHTRAFLFVILVNDTIMSMIMMEFILLLSVYVLRAPISWRVAEYSIFQMSSGFIDLFGLPLSLLILKRVLKMRNSSLMIIGSFFFSLRLIPIAFATDGMLIYVSAVIGFPDTVGTVGSKAFLGSILSPDEVGKYLAISAIVSKVVILLQSLLLTQIYKWTINLGLFHGFVWLIIGVVGFANTLLTAWMHVVSKREQIGS